MSVGHAATVLVSALGVVAGLAALAAGHRLRISLAVALDMWMAAGLLRLTADASWNALAGAAAILLVRKAITASLARPARA